MSCCVAVQNLERNLFVVPKIKLDDAGNPTVWRYELQTPPRILILYVMCVYAVQGEREEMGDVYGEVADLLNKHGIKQFLRFVLGSALSFRM